MKWAIQLASWACTLIIARILTPADYGIMGMATVYLGLVTLVNEFGITAAILRGRDLTERQIAQLGGFGILLGVAFCLISVGLAAPVGRFYGEPAVRSVIMLLSLTFLFSSIGVLPRSLLARELRYRELAWIDGAANLAQLVSTLALALLGFRYRALVFGGLIGSAMGTALATAIRRHRVAIPRDIGSLSASMRLGWHVVVGRIAWYTYQNADFAIVGRVLGKAVLGAYSLGWQIAAIPVERVSALVGQVTPGIFSTIHASPSALRRYYLGIIEGLAFITFPAAAGLALTAPVLVPTILGEQWAAAVLPLQLLALYGGIRSIDTVTPQVLLYTGHSRQGMWYTVMAAVVLPVLFYIGTRWGTAGVAAAWIIAYPVVVLPVYRIAFRVLELSPWAYLRNLWPAASSTLFMAMAVLWVRGSLAAALPPRTRLLAEVATGFVAYAAVMMLVHGGRLRAFRAWLREVRA